MAKVEIIRSLFEEIKKKFKGETQNIIDLLETLEQNPKKGRVLGNVGGIVIKELKYEPERHIVEYCWVHPDRLSCETFLPLGSIIGHTW